ncbi:MAG: nucleotide exchange factor GrpE [Propionibacteriales bacterium]|nr:nucleotide exchange factor GrpE [Propionibacteriales bacterium]
MTPEHAHDEEQERAGPVIRDRRRIDPETGAVREPQDTASPGGLDLTVPLAPAAGAVDAARMAELETALAERTLDLQRLQAEYVNYKRRVDRDRAVAREGAVGGVLAALLPVLDDIGRARDHGELEGGFKAVADSFERAVAALGLVRFGEAGEAFDPRVHEALMHAHSDEVDGPTCSAVLQAGYRIGERVLRPARVAVAEPVEPVTSTSVDDALVDPLVDLGLDPEAEAAPDPAFQESPGTESHRDA